MKKAEELKAKQKPKKKTKNHSKFGTIRKGSIVYKNNAALNNTAHVNLEKARKVIEPLNKATWGSPSNKAISSTITIRSPLIKLKREKVPKSQSEFESIDEKNED